MSKLSDLINELCPDGVEYRRLGDIATISRGGNLQKKDFCDEGTPCIHYGQIYTKFGLFTDKALTYIREDVAKRQKMASPNDIVMAVTSENIDDVCKCVVWLGDEDIAVSGHTAIIHHNQNAKYLAYYFHSNMFFKQKTKLAHGTKVIEVTPDKLNSVKIPVPPLEVQREIVRVLDSFTLLTAELTAELTARKKQYEYYRDFLIDNPLGNVQEKKMGDVLTFLNGRAYKQEELLNQGKYPVLRVGNFYTNDSWYYSDIELDSSKYCEKGDLLYSWAATLGPRIWDGTKCIYHYHIWKIIFDEDEIDKLYLYYYLQYDLKKISGSTTKSTMIHVSMSSMKERTIILPNIEEQRTIAGLISRFDKLCTDIKEGLPAEIEDRRKQYEYYRDRLLTFEQMGA